VNHVSARTAASTRTLRRAVLGVAAATATLAGPSLAAACSQDNTTYFESFLDTTCLVTPLTNTTLDALGGLRLNTNGLLTNKRWDTDVNFAGETGLGFPRVGVSTLATSGSGAGATLTLPTTPLPLTADPANPVLGPTTSAVLDGDNVGGPSVIKVGAQYVMYYTGSAEFGGPNAILRATSVDGKAWTRVAAPNTAVLSPTPGAFDEEGVSSPHVDYNATDLTTPYRMWYSGRGKVFGAIGYATSTDGITWTKYTGTPSPLDPPVAVLDHGIGGSGDSFSAADPSVIKDGPVWKMWYTGDDSNRKRINYATSVDGIEWQKGGTVLGPESANVTANFSEGAYAPVVWKIGSTYNMLFSGRKFVSGSSYQTKIQSSSSSDGISWGAVGVGLNPAGNNTKFDFSNLEAPMIFDEGVAGAEQYKLYYVGNTLDANGNGHDRIGLATSSNGASFGKFAGAQTLTSVLDIGALGTQFDARGASGVAAAVTTGSGADTYVGFHSGTRGTDFLPRIGESTSADAAVWTKVDGSATGGAIFDLGSGVSADNKGALEPAPLLDATTYNLYYTGLNSAATASILLRTSPQDGTTKQPTNAWSASGTQVVAGDASGFDATAVSHPSVIKDGGSYVMHYTGISAGAPEIGRITSASATFSSPTRSATPVVTKGAVGEFDANGAKDPVVVKVSGTDYRMAYTGIDADGIERLGYATSSDGATWTKQGVLLNPSHTGFAFDEVGLRAGGMMLDAAGTTLHLYTTGSDRTARQRSGNFTTPVTTVSGGIPMGWATYQLGTSVSPARDFRTITRTSTGTNVELWLSFLQPYSSGTDYWSEYFPVTQLSPTEQLNLLLTVRAIRWQARLSGPSGTPALDTVQVDHAPVQFDTTGSATTLNVEPASTLNLTGWNDLIVKTSTFSPNGGGTVSGTVSVRDADTGVDVLPAVTLNVSGTTTQSLATVQAAQHRRLKLVFSLTSDGAATPKVSSATVTYTATPLTEPSALFFVTPRSGVAPLAATLDATASRVPAGRTITAYNWDFDGNGVVDQVTATPTTTHTYLAGTWPAKLTITDSTGITSAVTTVTVTATDATAPIGVAITGPTVLSKPFQGLKTVALTWGGTDAESGIKSYVLTYRIALIGGAFGSPVLISSGPATSLTYTLKQGATYCFTALAINGAGLTTASSERCTSLPLHSVGLVAKGTWAKKTKAGHFLSRYRVATVKGATLSKTGVTVKRLSIVATKGVGMGSVTVYIGTTKLKTINLAATTTLRRQVISVANFAKVRKGTIRIVVATSGKPVIIEGLAVSKV
jgi:predicted GH43/DUF377 family glycosyl hydrolase